MSYQTLNEQKEKMKDFKFQIGDFVITSRSGYFDNVFGTSGDKIGLINGYDFENNYYRVYYDDWSNYIGTREHQISKYNGDVPDKLVQKKHYIESLMLKTK